MHRLSNGDHNTSGLYYIHRLPMFKKDIRFSSHNALSGKDRKTVK